MSSWPQKNLGDVAVIERDSIQPGEIKTGTSYLGLEHIESGGKILSVPEVSNGDLASSKFRFTSKHILYGKLRPYLAKIACPDFDGICSTDILPILPNDNMDKRYICYFLRQPDIIALANSKSSGANLPRLSPTSLSEILLPVPPLSEQKRIAEILDRAEALRAKRRAALALLDELTQSIFLDMFGDPVSNPKGWDSCDLHEICEEISDINHKMPKAVSNGVPFISAKDLTNDGRLSFEEVKYIAQADFQELSRKSCPRKGDIIYSRIGVNLGKARIVEVDFPFLVSYSCCIIRPILSRVSLSYLCQLMDSPFMLKQAHRGVRAIGVPDLGLGEIKKFSVILPPKKLQQDFEDRIFNLKSIKSLQRTGLSQLDQLFASLQHRAFRGEL